MERLAIGDETIAEILANAEPDPRIICYGADGVPGGDGDDADRDNFMSAEQSVEYGLIDEVLDRRPVPVRHHGHSVTLFKDVLRDAVAHEANADDAEYMRIGFNPTLTGSATASAC